MSKAFTKNDDDEGGGDVLPDREISPHANLVTAKGLAQIEQAIAKFERELAAARAADDRDAQTSVGRDLRYWTARRNSAELVPPPPDSRSVHFGSRVTLKRADGTRQTWHIVGEDEADPKRGSLPYVSPLARALLGKQVGEEVTFGDMTAEVLDIL